MTKTKTTKISIRYSTVDGYKETRKYTTLDGAREFAVKMLGEHPERGMDYAISGDGISKIDNLKGCTLDDLFPAPVVEDEASEIEDLADEMEDGEQEEARVTKTIVAKKWQAEYAKRPLKGTCSDGLAYTLKSLLNDEKGNVIISRVIALGWANGIDVEFRWGRLNPGQMRMNLGNALRHMIKNNKPVVLTLEDEAA